MQAGFAAGAGGVAQQGQQWQRQPGAGAVFKMGGRVVGEVPDADFSRLFFGIWLSPQTSEPGLRQELVAATRGPAGQP